MRMEKAKKMLGRDGLVPQFYKSLFICVNRAKHLHCNDGNG